MGSLSRAAPTVAQILGKASFASYFFLSVPFQGPEMFLFPDFYSQKQPLFPTPFALHPSS